MLVNVSRVTAVEKTAEWSVEEHSKDGQKLALQKITVDAAPMGLKNYWKNQLLLQMEIYLFHC